MTSLQCPALPNRATISGFFCRQSHAWSCLLHGHLENFLQLLGTGLPLKKTIISPCNLTCFWGKASGSGVGENLLEKRGKNNYGKTLWMEVFRQHPVITSKATSALLKT